MKADDLFMILFQVSFVGVLIDQHATALLIINAVVWVTLVLLAWALDYRGRQNRAGQ